MRWLRGGRCRRVVAGVAAVAFVVGAPTTLPASASAATAAPGSGIVVVGVESPSTSDPTRFAQATCPSGTVLYGGGGRITGGSGVVDLFQFQPGDPAVGDHAFRVTALESTPYQFTWRVHAFAICGPPLAGLERIVSAPSSLPVGATGTGALAVCPAGKVVISTGALATSPGEAPLHWIRPMSNGTEVFAVIHRDDRVTPTPVASVTAFALCAPAPPGYEIVASGTQPNPRGLKSVWAWCRDGQVALGGGLTMFDATGHGHHHFTGFIPDELFRQNIEVWAEGPGGTYDWAIASWALCADDA
jgi:hypothetical protein